ncbi:hypothetical protein [Psychromonas sp. Urea-02u-13]|uniref:hypothetical protein n=1 Tax=Psychromonas sp. Urea-02u-13 TaxID=2058326 RepID=UPI000C31E291|nr:hypothetical protein [Psychromonas sp. Urea-02u-13]PKG37486.1 hypothetical protein CXF74_18610 [Psychromonas sp. Urea-02u-13]
MVSAETLMEQAGETAEAWLRQAITATEHIPVSEEARATIIAAFIQAAAQDQHTMTIRALAENGLLNQSVE